MDKSKRAYDEVYQSLRQMVEIIWDKLLEKFPDKAISLKKEYAVIDAKLGSTKKSTVIEDIMCVDHVNEFIANTLTYLNDKTVSTYLKTRLSPGENKVYNTEKKLLTEQLDTAYNNTIKAADKLDIDVNVDMYRTSGKLASLIVFNALTSKTMSVTQTEKIKDMVLGASYNKREDTHLPIVLFIMTYGMFPDISPERIAKKKEDMVLDNTINTSMNIIRYDLFSLLKGKYSEYPKVRGLSKDFISSSATIHVCPKERTEPDDHNRITYPSKPSGRILETIDGGVTYNEMTCPATLKDLASLKNGPRRRIEQYNALFTEVVTSHVNDSQTSEHKADHDQDAEVQLDIREDGVFASIYKQLYNNDHNVENILMSLFNTSKVISQYNRKKHSDTHDNLYYIQRCSYI